MIMFLLTLLDALLSLRSKGVEAEALCVLRSALCLVGIRLASALVALFATLLDVMTVWLGRRRRRSGSDDGLGALLLNLLRVVLPVKGVIAQTSGILRGAVRHVGSRGAAALVVLVVALALVLRRLCLRGSSRRRRLGARRGSDEAAFIRVVAQAGGVLGRAFGPVGVGLDEACVVGGGALDGAFLGGAAAVVGEGRGDEGGDEDGGTHLFVESLWFLLKYEGCLERADDWVSTSEGR